MLCCAAGVSAHHVGQRITVANTPKQKLYGKHLENIRIRKRLFNIGLAYFFFPIIGTSLIIGFVPATIILSFRCKRIHFCERCKHFAPNSTHNAEETLRVFSYNSWLLASFPRKRMRTIAVSTMLFFAILYAIITVDITRQCSCMLLPARSKGSLTTTKDVWLNAFYEYGVSFCVFTDCARYLFSFAPNVPKCMAVSFQFVFLRMG